MWKKLLIAGTALLSMFSATAQEVEKELALFDAGKEKSIKWYCSTCSWIKGSNFKAKTEIVDRNDEKWLLVSFSGDSGSARWVINNLNLDIPEGFTARGLEVTIDYRENDFKKIQIGCHFKNKKKLTKTLALEKGVKTYYFDKGWTRTGIPSDWSGLTQIAEKRGVSKTAVWRQMRKIAEKYPWAEALVDIMARR
ncbi:MAG: hypothetical protein GY750_19095 [Lentisphaerae bacterium]|nr:hypothetical protein [Lentisphaerota bacterium]MCP4103505.1 hypothetical protein [Lentisphaerota bacterium]